MSTATHPEPAQPTARELLEQAGRRLLEAMPGVITWIVLLSPAWLSADIFFGGLGAFWVAYGVLVFDLYWFFRSFFVIYCIHRTYARMRADMGVDWLDRCARFEPSEGRPDPLDYHHLSLIPTYTEPFHVLDATVRALAEASYPAEKKIVAIITRETDLGGWENVAKLRERYGTSFARFYHIKDPLEPGIVVGKSAAMNWGGRWITGQLREDGYDIEKVLITDLDSDYRVHPQYFAWISYHHALEAKRSRVIWQPVPVFHNNIWDVPGPIRVMSASTTQWQMFLHQRPDRLVAFSSYTCPLQFAEDIGFWDKDVIPEDSRFYWKAFFRFGSAFAVKPCFLPLYGDSPKGRDMAGSLRSQYNQIKRWAWGVTDVPYVVSRIRQHPEIPLWLRLRKFSYLFFNHLNWVFLPVFLMFGANIPVWVSLDFSLTELGQVLWLLSGGLLTLTLIATISLIRLDHRMLPPKPAAWSTFKRFRTNLVYLAYPIIGLVLSVLPALDAHTRLLLGKYLEYRVTEKG